MDVIVNGRRYIPEPPPRTARIPFERCLRDAREERGWTLDQVADAVGMSKTYLWELERGNRGEPGFRIVARLAALYRIDLGYLAACMAVSDAAEDD